jgi:23S rRNA-/tRNA-specific pseudouridylate synthase
VGPKKAKPSLRVDAHQEIRLEGDIPEEIPGEQAPKLSERIEKPQYRGPLPVVLYEDQDILVIDKPVGVSVHPGPARLSKKQWLLGCSKKTKFLKDKRICSSGAMKF